MECYTGDGFNFHFWSSADRGTIDPNDIAGVFTSVQARLIVGNSTLSDDRDRARYLLSTGADYWLNKTAQWDNFKTNGDVGISRFKYVTKDWQTFNMITRDRAGFYCLTFKKDKNYGF
jgi:hypothetical protein